MKPSMPMDAFNEKRMESVFPGEWRNPRPVEMYDLVVIGGGPGGLSAAMTAVSRGAKVAIVEKEHLGGECFNVGCIPSKAFLRSSRVAASIQKSKEFGIEVPKGWKVDFPAVMERVRRLQSILAPGDSAARLKSLGVDVFLGAGRFTDKSKVLVGNDILHFKKAIIATGTHPLIPEIQGLKEAGYLTNQTVFNLTELPSRLAVLGAGPIGCELSQAFLRMGSDVTLITRGAALLPKDDMAATERLVEVLKGEGMNILFQTQVERVEKKGKEKILYLTNGKSLIVDDVLVAIGRLPTVGGLDLEKAGVIYDLKKGIAANDFLTTSNPNIYVVGDVGSEYKFTHMAIELGKIAVLNALYNGKENLRSLIVPWSTYTEPEIAHIGLQEKELDAKGISVETSLIELKHTERAVLDGETIGFVKIHRKAGTDQILGATIMATHAGDMIAELAVAMSTQKGVTAITTSIHPFPTQAEAIRTSATQLAEQNNSSRQKSA